jgi:hypothetical protein
MVNVSSIINGSIIPSSITDKVTNDINIIMLVLKAIGVLIIIYIIFLVVKWISDFIRNRRIGKIYQKVNEMDKKLDIILERTKIRVDKKEKRK